MQKAGQPDLRPPVRPQPGLRIPAPPGEPRRRSREEHTERGWPATTADSERQLPGPVLRSAPVHAQGLVAPASTDRRATHSAPPRCQLCAGSGFSDRLGRADDGVDCCEVTGVVRRSGTGSRGDGVRCAAASAFERLVHERAGRLHLLGRRTPAHRSAECGRPLLRSRWAWSSASRADRSSVSATRR